MSQGKIEFVCGNLSFVGEGEQDWLAQQLDKVLSATPVLAEMKQSANGDTSSQLEEGSEAKADSEFNEPLASYIKQKGAESNQVKRFLATADWLRQRGDSNLKTKAVSGALAENHQQKLINPAQSLNNNVKKGFCEKRSNGTFFITPLGLKELGHA